MTEWLVSLTRFTSIPVAVTGLVSGWFTLILFAIYLMILAEAIEKVYIIGKRG